RRGRSGRHPPGRQAHRTDAVRHTPQRHVPPAARGLNTGSRLRSPTSAAQRWGATEEQAMNDRVTISIGDGVADVRMVRVDKMNALDNAMFEALGCAGERLKTEKGVRAVVLSGEGRAFCAGLDMGNFGRMAEGPRRERNADSIVATGRTEGGSNRAQHAVMVWREIPVPVIAAVHG